jgi:hypothetical protein
MQYKIYDKIMDFISIVHMEQSPCEQSSLTRIYKEQND